MQLVWATMAAELFPRLAVELERAGGGSGGGTGVKSTNEYEPLLGTLVKFTRQLATTFELSYTAGDKLRVVNAILALLGEGAAPTAFVSAHADGAALALDVLRICQRDPKELGALQQRFGLRFFLSHARSPHDAVAQAAAKNINNAVYNNPAGQAAFMDEHGVRVLLEHLQRGSTTMIWHLRVLFIMLATNPAALTEARIVRLPSLAAVATSVDILGAFLRSRTAPYPGHVGALAPISKTASDEITEAFKVLYSLTQEWSRTTPNGNANPELPPALHTVLAPVQHGLTVYLARATEPCISDLAQLRLQVVNLFVNTPSGMDAVGFAGDDATTTDNSPVRAYARDLCALVQVGAELQDSQEQKQLLLPLLTYLGMVARGHSPARRALHACIFAQRVDTAVKPEAEDTFRGVFSRLMTSISSDVQVLTSDFLFVLCKERPSSLVRETGFGNAAGLLMQRGFLMGTPPSAPEGEYSSDDDDDDDEGGSKAARDSMSFARAA